MSAKTEDIINGFVDAIRETDKPAPYDTTATVRRIEDGVAWVHIPGGVDETPVTLTIAAAVGDNVQVRVANGRAFLVGNATAPPTDDTTALVARTLAKDASQTAETAQQNARDAKASAGAAYKIAADTNQYFWHTETGADTGAHITEIPREDFEADPSNGGGNLLARSNGIAVRDGLVELATFSADGLQVMADDGVTQIAHLGYGLGAASGGGTSDAPYYTLGVRPANSTVGNYSTAEGRYTTASGVNAHAEGGLSIASGAASHAEGNGTEASGNNSHAEGSGTEALGNNSHAEGFNTHAHGPNSHAQGANMHAYEGQFAFGKNGVGTNSNIYAAVMGNGANANNPKNGFLIDWDGRIECGDYGGNLKSIFDIFYPVGSYYETSDTTFNPATAWGGTWELEVAGQVHVSAGTGYTVAGALTNTTDGGEKEHTLTVNEMPAHSHIRNRNSGYDNNFATGSGRTIPTNNSVGNQGNIRTADTGGGQAHNNMPPYIVVNRWHRTA